MLILDETIRTVTRTLNEFNQIENGLLSEDEAWVKHRLTQIKAKEADENSSAQPVLDEMELNGLQTA